MEDLSDAPAVHTDWIRGWYCWQSPQNQLWHARKRGSEPPVLIHSDSLEDLRQRVKELA